MRDTDLAITFFTFLTLLANAATLGLAGTAGAARLTGRPGARRAWASLHREVAGGAVGLAWLVAAVAMSGSLYFSEVANFLPCRLCWAQRACMYPLVVVLALAGLARGRVARTARRAGLALATVGAGIAVYHVLVERFPSLESGTCDPTNPCSLIWFERFGFVTLPYMALSGFSLIGALLLTAGARQPAPATTTGTGVATRTTGTTGASAATRHHQLAPATPTTPTSTTGINAATRHHQPPPATPTTPTSTTGINAATRHHQPPPANPTSTTGINAATRHHQPGPSPTSPTPPAGTAAPATTRTAATGAATAGVAGEVGMPGRPADPSRSSAPTTSAPTTSAPTTSVPSAPPAPPARSADAPALEENLS